MQELGRVEQHLFEAVEDLPVTYLSSVRVDDEIVVVAKQRISAVVLNNSHGPTQYDTFLLNLIIFASVQFKTLLLKIF